MAPEAITWSMHLLFRPLPSNRVAGDGRSHLDSGQTLSLGVLWRPFYLISGELQGLCSHRCFSFQAYLSKCGHCCSPGPGEVLLDSPSCPHPQAHRTPKFLTCRGEKEISLNTSNPRDNDLQGNPSLVSRGELHPNSPLTSSAPESPGSL